MTDSGQQTRVSPASDPFASLLAAIGPLSEIVGAIVPDARLTVVSIGDQALEIVASTGVDPFATGTCVRSPSIGPPCAKLLDDGPFIAAISDPEITQDVRDSLTELGFERGFVAPLHLFGDVAYCVVIDRSMHPLTLEPSQHRVLAAAIAQAAEGIENADLRFLAARGKRTLEAVVHLGIALSSVLDLQIIAAQVVEYACLLLDLPAATLLYRTDGDTDYIVLASEGLPANVEHIRVTALELEELEARVTHAVNRTADTLGGILQVSSLSPTFSTRLNPGSYRQAVLLGLDRAKRRPTEEELGAFELLAIQAATAMRGARLFAEVVAAQELGARQLARTQLLNNATIAATSSMSVKDVAERVLVSMAQGLDLKLGSVYLFDEESSQLSLLAAHGMVPAHLEQARSLPVAEGVQTMESRAVVERRIVGRHANPVTETRREMLRSAGLAATETVAIPLESGDHVIGVLSLVLERDEAVSADEMAVFRSLAGILGQAVKNAQLLENAMESARLSDALNAANAAVHSSLDIDEVVRHALEAGIGALECEAALIEMRSGAAWIVRHQQGFSPDIVGVQLSVDDAQYASTAARTGIPYTLGIRPDDNRMLSRFARVPELKSVLVVPLLAKDAVVGCALFYTSAEGRRFTAAELDFGKKLGSAVSLGLENARLYEGQHRIAETLQQALLSLPDRIEGVEFAPYYHSATKMTLVGGDFYDLFELEGGRVGIIIGDISGKGLDAAVLTSLVKNTIRAHASHLGTSPAHVIELTNDVVNHATSSEAFATVFFGILDRATGHLVYTNAGHTTSAILRHDGSVSRLPGTGSVVGAFPGFEFGQAEVELGPRDSLFLYTDGLTEARHDREFYGEERLFSLLASASTALVGDAVDEVVADVMSFTGNHLRDDLAILALRAEVDSPV